MSSKGDFPYIPMTDWDGIFTPSILQIFGRKPGFLGYQMEEI